MDLTRIPFRAGNLKAELTFYKHDRYIICCLSSSGTTDNDSNHLILVERTVVQSAALLRIQEQYSSVRVLPEVALCSGGGMPL